MNESATSLTRACECSQHTILHAQIDEVITAHAQIAATR